MTEKDKKLIKKARQVPYMEDYLVNRMAEEADTEEAKEELRSIARELYHFGECIAGCL